MRTDQFDFDLPPELIAQAPTRPRDSARLLIIADRLRQSSVAELPQSLRSDDLLVVNDTRVLPVRLRGSISDQPISLTFLEAQGNRRWLAFAKPGKRLKVGSVVDLQGAATVEVVEKHKDGQILFEFDRDDAEITALFHRIGAMPLPPYIKRDLAGSTQDHDDYQTIFAARDGAVAAPTASLHFTQALHDALKQKGIALLPVTLHVGAGTFLPVKTENTDDHRMHSERMIVSLEAANEINQARRQGRRVVAIGTTALRALESSTDSKGDVRALDGRTDLFITPGYRFRTVDVLMTNFHLPKSTLFMLVSAFAGRKRMLDAYRFAIAQRYRFFSYGDATLIERAG